MTRLDEIGGLLTDKQLDELLVGAAEHELWTELEELVANLTGERLTRLAEHYRRNRPACARRTRRRRRRARWTRRRWPS